MTDTPAPLRRDAEHNRRRILAAARQLFAETGLAAGHDDVARAAGVGVGTVYRRFPRKEDLLLALFEDQVERVGQLAEAALAEPDPWLGLRGFLEATLELQASDRGLQEFLYGDHGLTLAGRARRRIAPVVGELLARAQATGQVRGDLTVQDVALVPIMVGAVTDRARDVAPDLWRRVLALVLDGMRPVESGGLPGEAVSFERFEQIMSSWRPSGSRSR